MLGRFRDHIFGALTCASRQRKIVVKGCGPSQRNRFIPWINVFGRIPWIDDFGEGADEEDLIVEIDDFVVKLNRSTTLMTLLENSTHTLCLLQPTQPTELSEILEMETAGKPGDDCTASTTRRRPRDAWRFCSKFRIHRVVSELRIWYLRLRTGSQRNVSTRCSPTGTDGPALVAAMFPLMPKSLEETVMFANEDEGFQELSDRLLAYSSTKQSVKMSESKRQTRRDDPIDVDALSKGKSKGKGKKSPVSSGKGNKGQN